MKLLSRLFLGLLLFCIFSLSSNVQADVTLFANGRSEATIVVEADAAPVVKFAAKELQDYLKKQGKADIPISATPGAGVNVFLGEGAGTAAAGLDLDGVPADGFKIVTKDGNLYIFGVDRKKKEPIVGSTSPFQAIHQYNDKLGMGAYGATGTLYGVYYLLREFAGINWYMPGEIGEVIPERAALVIPEISLKKTPDFEYRLAYWGLWNMDDDASLWYRRIGYGAPEPIEIVHTFYRLNQYQKEHPEWFALYKGERDFNITCENRGNLCLSNPEVLDAFVKLARGAFDSNPESKIFSVMPNDWFNQICECEECQKQADYDRSERGKFSNYVWNFVNKVAKEVKKTHPDRLIGCCAYNTYAEIPDRVQLEDNVAVSFTKALYACYDDAYRVRNDQWLYDWAKVVKNIYTWDYYCWHVTAGYLNGLPIIYPHWLEKDLRNQKGLTKGMFIDGGADTRYGYKMAHPFMMCINYYLTARLLWDTSLSVDGLLDDYFRNFYGPAAEELRKYWRRGEEIWCNLDVKERGQSDVNRTLFTPEVLLELKGYLYDGLKKVEMNSAYAARINGILGDFGAYVDRITNTRSQIPDMKIKRAPKELVLDGKMEKAWRQANVMDFVDMFSANAPLADTYARVFHDDDNLYMFITCFEPNMKTMSAKATPEDAMQTIWNDDAIEIFIVPDKARPNMYVQLAVNSKGVFVDGVHGTDTYGVSSAFDYQSGMACRAGTDKNGWTLEIQVPKKAFDIEGSSLGKEFLMNIGRDRLVNEIDTQFVERSSWSAMLSDLWHNPSRFGNVTLEE